MRLGTLSKARCVMAIAMGNLHSRCFYKPGHGGPHEARGLKKFPYQRIKWFQGDGREYQTERTDEWAWTPRKQKVAK